MILAGGPFGLGPIELVLIVVVLLLVFGVGKIADLGGSLGTGIREFRKNIKDDSPEPPATETAATAIATNATTAPPTSAPPTSASATNGGVETVSAVKCPNCGTLNPVGARHCNQCGTALTAPVS